MKKIIATILTIAMLITATTAFAAGGMNGGQKGGPQGGPQMQGSPQMGGNNDRQTPPEKPDAAPEKPTGEKPADAPAEPEELTDDKPEMPSGEAPQGQKPTDGQQAPQGQDGQAPKMIDFDAMVTKGIISQETREAIKAYMHEHKPADMPADGQAPADGQTPPEKPDDGQAPEGNENGLLNDLLNAGIITQDEYDAMVAA